MLLSMLFNTEDTGGSDHTSEWGQRKVKVKSDWALIPRLCIFAGESFPQPTSHPRIWHRYSRTNCDIPAARSRLLDRRAHHVQSAVGRLSYANHRWDAGRTRDVARTYRLLVVSFIAWLFRLFYSTHSFAVYARTLVCWRCGNVGSVAQWLKCPLSVRHCHWAHSAFHPSESVNE